MRSLVLLLAACTTEEAFEAGTGESPAELIARECKERHLTCALVYAFEAPADNRLGRVEMCVREQDLELAESIYGASELSPDERFVRWALLGIDPICLWQCPSGVGCNAFGGPSGSCFCPEAL